MKRSDRPEASAERNSIRYIGLLVVAAIVLVAAAILMPRLGKEPSEPLVATNSALEEGKENRAKHYSGQVGHAPAASEGRASAQEIVSAKLAQFARGRQQIVAAMAGKFQVEVAPDVAQFFAAVEAARWDEVTNLFAVLNERRKSPEANDLQTLWGPIQETFGVAEVAHKWPSDKLLSYGQAILDSLRPGMVYAGGTDAGRFIPTLLNETNDGERHIVLTQNALADNTYLKYLNFLYGDRMAPITPEEAQKAFSDYLTDAQERLKKDQLRPGEDVRITDNRVQVSGQVAVMAINERLFQMISEKNPDLSFAMEESFPFKTAYSDAVPLGPILALRSADSQTSFEELAGEAVDYWRNQAQQFTPGQDTPEDEETRKAWAKMASAQGGLLQDRGTRDQAASIYDVALQICPSSPEVVFRYANLLLAQNKPDAALQVAERGLAAAPGNGQFRDLAGKLREWAALKK